MSLILFSCAICSSPSVCLDVIATKMRFTNLLYFTIKFRFSLHGLSTSARVVKMWITTRKCSQLKLNLPCKTTDYETLNAKPRLSREWVKLNHGNRKRPLLHPRPRPAAAVALFIKRLAPTFLFTTFKRILRFHTSFCGLSFQFSWLAKPSFALTINCTIVLFLRCRPYRVNQKN